MHSVVKVGQVWASTCAGDIRKGERQRRKVVDLTERYAYLKTEGSTRIPTRVLLTVKGITGHRLVEERRVILEVHGWHTQCGACGYGRGGWAGGPANEGKPILTPGSRTCHGCGAAFTHVFTPYGNKLTVLPAQEAEAA